MNDHPTPDDPGADDAASAARGTENLSEHEAAAREALRAAPAPQLSDIDRRRMVRRALDEGAPPAGAASTTRSSGAGRGARPWIAVGAAAAVVAVTLFTVSWLSNRGDEEVAGGGTSGDAVSSLESADAADTDGDDAPSVRRVDTQAVQNLGHLGEFTDDAQLLATFDIVGASGMTADGDAAPVPAAVVECLDAITADFIPVAAGTLTYAGTAAVVIGGENAAGEAVVHLMATADCTPFEGWGPRPL